MAEISKALKQLNEELIEVRKINNLTQSTRLLAVSKTKPKEMIISAYESGQRYFGENYIQELSEKSNDPEILDKCPDINWHFIGNLQRNKVNKLVTSPNLFVVETVNSEKIAIALDEAWKKQQNDKPLSIMVQVNTSGEEGKNGCSPDKSLDLTNFIIKNCPSLKFIGLMTIGERRPNDIPNPDFMTLKNCRENICDKLKLNIDDIELSMGMSDDYIDAIKLGSTNVRIGSLIFGQRQVKEK